MQSFQQAHRGGNCLSGEVGRILALKDVYFLISGNCEYVMVPDKGELRWQMQFRLLTSWLQDRETVQEGPMSSQGPYN